MQKVFALICALSTIFLVWWLVRYSAYGIDFTDESFYLLWIANPHKYSWPASQFGFLYHPIYSLVDGDIATLRRINILATFALAWFLCHMLIAHVAPSLKRDDTPSLTVSAGLATGALVLFESWLITPNYNSLNFQALLITAVGVVLADKSAHRSSIIGWMLIGTGGWLTFMAKPSTALATGIALIFYLFFADKFSFRKFVITLFYVVALLLLSALIFDGSVPAFIKRFQLGFEFSMLQGGGYKPSEMLRINGFVFNDRLMIAFSLIFFAVSFAFYSSWKGKSVVSLIISGIFFLITALITLGQVDWNAGLGQFQGLLIFALIGSMYFSALVLG
ncbi:MAG: hypothetical protein FJX94_09115, partial [Bacteroidetes bacterium]|nr:hypothetical protein [Bacteroidota bacterium]